MTASLTIPMPKTTPKPQVGVGVVVVRPVGGTFEVLLIRRGKPPGEGIWSIPGGRLELGETVREAGAREIKEETGIAITDLTLIDVVDAFVRDGDGAVDAHWTLIDF